MKRETLIKKYIEFFKKNNHKEVPNSSLIPLNDPTTLFNSAGMQPLVPYLLGQKHPHGKRLVNVQKCIRTQDIEEVGDATHHTFFEMLGNWSLGDYWKKEAIEMSFNFLTKELNLPIERLAVSVFKGNKNAQKDEESAKIWQDLQIPSPRIAFLPEGENWWGPAGTIGPCGPDTEMFYWKPSDIAAPEKFDSKDERWVEIWNDVLMQYNKDEKGNYNEAKQKNIDTGMGVERTIAILQGFQDNYLTEVWQPIIKKIEELSKQSYEKDYNKSKMRIIADHIKAAIFIISDGISPSNTEQGYVLRRLIRRAIRYGKQLGLRNFTPKIAEAVFEIYQDYDLEKNKISKELQKEEEKFNKTLKKGLRVFEKTIEDKKEISGTDAFLLYQSYGFPIEMTTELAKERNVEVAGEDFYAELDKHQELSKTASAGKFKSGLADNSAATTRLHTATHLLNEALSIVLKREVKQRGSNINPERLRFDFTFDRKLSAGEIKEVEDLVNAKIGEGCKVTKEEMPLKEALDSGAQGEFGAKYPEVVSVYTVEGFSKEICTGPHVKNTNELGTFKIKKEFSSSAGVRRIKATLE